MTRDEVTLKTPLLITLKIKEKLPTLRNKSLFKTFKKRYARAREFGLYVIHFSIQADHIHLFAEAEDNESIALGIRSLAGTFAKTLRRHAHQKGGAKRTGSVFKGRYHVHVLKTPRETRNALQYVLLNTSKHRELIPYIDDFSSGAAFSKWTLLLGNKMNSLVKIASKVYEDAGPRDDLARALSPPQSWLAKRGWTRAKTSSVRHLI